MTQLGSRFVSTDTDARGTPGPKGDTGGPGPAGPVGDVPLTTKGDIMTYDTGDQRLPVGADGEVLTADSAQPTGIKWAPSAGGGTSASFTGLPPAANFYMGGELASSSSQKSDRTVVADGVHIDYIYFSETTTTINKLIAASATASSGGSLIVALHPMTSRVVLGNQSFVGTLTIGTLLDSVHEETLSTPWVVPKGHYALVVYNPGASITNVIAATAGSTAGGGAGIHRSMRSAFFNATADETEFKCIQMKISDYDTTPNQLAAVNFNDETNWATTIAVDDGKVSYVADAFMIGLRVDSTT